MKRTITKGRIYLRGTVWWLQYGHRGADYRESTGETDESRARQILKQRLAEAGADKLGLRKFVGPVAERITVTELLAQLEKDFELRGIKGLKQAKSLVKMCGESFGQYRAKEITADGVDKYVEKARKAGAKDSTINRRIQLLKQALAFGKERGLVASVPKLRKLGESQYIRRGFFERAEYEALSPCLPEYLQDFCRFAYHTGWRKSAIRSLRWADVDMGNQVIRLRPEHDKIGEGQALALEGGLLAILQRQAQCRAVEHRRTIVVSEFVFHYRGRKVGDFKRSWAKACKDAKLPNRHFHDFRRTFVRNAVAAGNDPWLVMQITGHKTLHTLNRYNIKTLDQQRAALQKTQEHIEKQSKEPKILELRDNEQDKINNLQVVTKKAIDK